MKKRTLLIFAMCFVVLYIGAQKIVTLRDEQHSWSFMGWNLKIKGPYIERSIFTTGTRKSDTEFYANDFNVSFRRVPGIETTKSAGAYVTEQGNFKVIEQANMGLAKDLFPTLDLVNMFKGLDELNGGIKQYFRILDQEFALLALKDGACTFGTFGHL